MSKTACAECTFFDHDEAGSQKPGHHEGLCRFNPPVSQPTSDAHGLWPVVGDSDWCGHFTAGRQAAE